MQLDGLRAISVGVNIYSGQVFGRGLEVIYLADNIVSASNGRIPSRFRKGETGGALSAITRLEEIGQELTQREIYAFDRSALNAASDLRIDAPGRLEALVDAVLRSPRSLFLEADLDDLRLIGAEIRDVLGQGVVQSSKAGQYRWGAFVDILGEGRARFRIAYRLPRKWWKGTSRQRIYEAEISTLPSMLRSRVIEALDISIEPDVFAVDLNRKSGLSKNEFRSALFKIKGSQDPIFHHAKARLEETQGARAQARIVDHAWQAARFRDLVRPDGTIDGIDRDGEATDSLGHRHDQAPIAFGLPIIAMLAVLQADSSDIRKGPRSHADHKSRRSGKGEVERSQKTKAPGLSVVTLNLEDRDLQRIYDASSPEAGLPSAERGNQGSGRIRHPVRGHLFLARNGKMTWRKPHWRGSLDQPTLKRVVAPSRGS